MTVQGDLTRENAIALLRWYADMGVDEAVSADPADFFTWKPAKSAAPGASFTGAQGASSQNASRSASGQQARRAQSYNAPPNAAAPTNNAAPKQGHTPADEAVMMARDLAAQCNSYEELTKAVAAFDACPLKAGARNTVFTDGALNGDLLVIGEAPGRDEDQIGKPFVGRAGQLLDKMLAAIGRSREKDTLISNVIFWRPPGNRTPTAIETAMCRPFVDRLIALTKPKAIMLAGGAPTQAMLGVSGIMRARGIWREITPQGGAPIPTLPVFHPAFLLRQPGQKRAAWHDLLALQAKLAETRAS